MFIAGKWEEAAGGRRFDVTNPFNGEVIADVADGRNRKPEGEEEKMELSLHDSHSG